MQIFEYLTSPEVLPVIFGAIMALAVLVYVILDGYDLGVGILLPFASEDEKDRMVSSIGPFWDANETWLVLGVGVLLVAFPHAHGVILSSLYLPTAAMLLGLIMRGVSFDFRSKVPTHRKALWTALFTGGSLLATLSQGYMIGLYVVGFERTFENMVFASICGISLVAGYSYLGAAWLIIKTEGRLQRRAVAMARFSLWATAVALGVVSLFTPIVSPFAMREWFAYPEVLELAPLPIICLVTLFVLDRALDKLPLPGDRGCWIPFVGATLIFATSFIGLALTMFPYLVVNKLTLWQAASANESLKIIFYGVLVIFPVIVFYTIYAYRVFWGKATEHHY